MSNYPRWIFDDTSSGQLSLLVTKECFWQGGLSRRLEKQQEKMGWKRWSQKGPNFLSSRRLCGSQGVKTALNQREREEDQQTWEAPAAPRVSVTTPTRAGPSWALQPLPTTHGIGTAQLLSPRPAARHPNRRALSEGRGTAQRARHSLCAPFPEVTCGPAVALQGFGHRMTAHTFFSRSLPHWSQTLARERWKGFSLFTHQQWKSSYKPVENRHMKSPVPHIYKSA